MRTGPLLSPDAKRKSKQPGLTDPATISPWRNLTPEACASSTSERSRSTPIICPAGPMCSAIHTDIDPLPQPTSSTRASRLIPSDSMHAGASDQVIATSRRAAFSRLQGGDPTRIKTSGRSVAAHDSVTSSAAVRSPKVFATGGRFKGCRPACEWARRAACHLPLAPPS